MTEPAGDKPALAEFGDDFSSVLCVVAHPDDIEYGTAAAVAKWTAAGKAVTYFLLTRGEAGIDTMHPDEAAGVREQEERDGASIVGVSEVDFGTHRDGNVEYGLALRRDIAREIRRRKPDVVVTGHYGDRFAQGMLNQADHRAVGLACVDAVADAGNRWIFPELVEEGFEPWNVKRLCFGGSPTATHFVDVSEHVGQAVASLEAHQAYNAALPDDFPKPAELINMILGWGGQAAGVEKAMAFDVVQRG
ncbi:LmbE family N-acetylglucosaminyl deacetylase [Phycicoccus badiiscoriae]|uniref:LmbE family N-acetylglucosaminyl deacetylase n=1 Tax=Pedococcus badiiscoriae TaxID=642776 RepID=A0A852WAZ3_9MICO|nr:PIG-L deacetylase family protein [Pedococcus badiiscoriae]NYG06218.1 LmbE family N-acetylglucosaminyl deacetylase [Pedococcus badiiscoriae]